ncbi:glycosyltransferase family 2 protein [Mesorhizobium sp. M1328]|uniref:glycosyltransferase family 2 protein n=1 Tax=Mesorhizobium sp. M1328 TaxID=2957082 RepID=UPI003336BB6F
MRAPAEAEPLTVHRGEINKSPDIHALILTKDEEIHIGRCIESLLGRVSSITVIDSGSSDNTREIAASLGAVVVENQWVNYATQMNFGIDLLSDKGGWLLRIDADEVLDAKQLNSLPDTVLKAAADCDGILIKRRIYFLGRRIRFGGIEPSWQLRLWRNGRGKCEQRWMDEHIIVERRVQKSSLSLSDRNLKSLTWWMSKHNSYASREAADILIKNIAEFEQNAGKGSKLSGQAAVKRFMKEKIYLKMPTALRASAYFLYRYAILLGFLDGKPGLYFHLLQGFLYRTLVDAKVDEIIDLAKKTNMSLEDAIKDRTGIDLRSGV